MAVTDARPELTALIRDVPDFPQPGILFKDITPLLADGPAFRAAVEALAARCRPWRPELVVGVESRGFLFGAPVALALGVGFAPARKPGKLPAASVRQGYALEYGSDALELHADAVRAGQRVVLVDDLLATGGTAAAALRLIERLGGVAAGAAFLIELTALHGRHAIDGYAVEALIAYE